MVENGFELMLNVKCLPFFKCCLFNVDLFKTADNLQMLKHVFFSASILHESITLDCITPVIINHQGAAKIFVTSFFKLKESWNVIKIGKFLKFFFCFFIILEQPQYFLTVWLLERNNLLILLCLLLLLTEIFSLSFLRLRNDCRWIKHYRNNEFTCN